MAGLTGQQMVTDQDIRTTSTSRGSALLGQKVITSDGRQFTYNANTSTSVALSPGKLTQGAIGTANHLNQTGVVLAAGTQQNITYTIGATAITADQYTQGYFVVIDGTGPGQALQIASHNTPGSAGKVTLTLYDA